MAAFRRRCLPVVASPREEILSVMKVVTKAQRASRVGLDWRFDDLSGKTFGRLRVLSADGTDKSGHHQWHCVCSCGARKVINGTSLRLGRTRSCGCHNDALRGARLRALRLTRLPFRRAICIMAALERAIGIDRLNRIFAARAARKPKVDAIKTT